MVHKVYALTIRERDILREREALPPTMFKTLAEKWHVSISRIRQIHRRALEKRAKARKLAFGKYAE